MLKWQKTCPVPPMRITPLLKLCIVDPKIVDGMLGPMIQPALIVFKKRSSTDAKFFPSLSIPPAITITYFKNKMIWILKIDKWRSRKKIRVDNFGEFNINKRYDWDTILRYHTQYLISLLLYLVIRLTRGHKVKSLKRENITWPLHFTHFSLRFIFDVLYDFYKIKHFVSQTNCKYHVLSFTIHTCWQGSAKATHSGSTPNICNKCMFKEHGMFVLDFFHRLD